MSATPLDIERVPLHGVTLIEASAGTGKTYTLAALFVRLLLEAELTVDQILVVTYTRAATAELRVRIRRRIVQTLDALDGTPPADDPLLCALCERVRAAGEQEPKRKLLSDALLAFDEAAIFTIHGFCQRVLKRHAFESGASFEAELSEDQSLLLDEVVRDFWARELATASEPFVRALKQLNVNIDSLLRFVRRALPNPELRVLPALPLANGAEREPPRALVEAFTAARAQAASLWASDSERILRLLRESALHKALYAPAKLEQFAAELACLADADVLQLPACLEKLTPALLLKNINKGFRPPEHAFFHACAELLEHASPLKAAHERGVHAFLHELLAYARAELARRSEASGTLGFDDLLLKLFGALRGPDGDRLAEVVQRSYRAALIDEFQDTDPVQLEVFRRIYAPRPGAVAPALFLIGDPKQAIYAFRGADIFAYLAAASGAIDRVHSLATNYRSDPGLLAAISQLYARAERPFVFEEISYRPVDARPGAQDALTPSLELLVLQRPPGQDDKPLSKADAESQLPGRVAAEISRLLASDASLEGERVQPGDVAVLCRTNAQAAQVQAALRMLGIPAVLDGDASVFDSAMAEELGRLLWAMAEPADGARVRAALATAAVGQTAEQLLALEADEAAWDEWVVRFHLYQSLWQTRGFLRALHTLCEALEVSARLLALPDGERRYTDLWHLAELLHEEEQRTRKGPHALLDFYRRVREGSAAREGMALEDVQVRLESDAHAVTLTTIHKSKGLEYPIVYCPYLWVSSQLMNGDKLMPLYHDRAAQDRATLFLPGDRAGSVNAREREAALEGAQLEARAEGARLLYVALTRAKHRLSLVWGALYGYADSALGGLLQPQGGNDAQLVGELEQLAALSGGRLAARPLMAAEEARHYEPPRTAAEALRPRVASFPAHAHARVGSFSALVESDKWHPRPEPEALDRDALTSALTSLEPELAAEPRVPLADFATGASFGHLVHAIYENADFTAVTPDALTGTVRAVLDEYAADASWAEPLTAAIHETLQTPLSAAGGELPSLASVSREQRLNELEFMFPVAETALSDAPRAALSARQLSQLLADHAASDAERAYAAQLGKLRFAPLRGFLRGFIDLVVEHAGRYYVLDYKSNRLGETARDYRRPQLVAEMHRHHYTLQYLLYSVAVHRYLGLRLPGYDYDRHFGGVYYLFIRGMSPKHEAGSGVLYERPSRALIDALSGLLSRPEVSA